MLNFAYKNMDDLCIENKRRWKEELAAGLGQLMFIMVEARTTEELYLLCWVLCELWAGIGFNTFFVSLLGKRQPKGGAVGGQRLKSFVSFSTEREPRKLLESGVSARAKIGHTIKSLWCVRRTPVTEGGPVRVCAQLQ